MVSFGEPACYVTHTVCCRLGEPECRSEVGRLVCLCRETLCNSVLARQLQQPRPEGGDTQGGLVLLLLALALLFLPLLFIAFSRAWRSSSSRSHSSDEEKALPALLPVPLYRHSVQTKAWSDNEASKLQCCKSVSLSGIPVWPCPPMFE